MPAAKNCSTCGKPLAAATFDYDHNGKAICRDCSEQRSVADMKRVAAESLHESEHRWFLVPVLFALAGFGTSEYLHFPRWVAYGAAFAFFILGSLLLAILTSPESVTVEKEKSDAFDSSAVDDYGLGKPLARLSLWLAEWARRQLSKRK